MLKEKTAGNLEESEEQLIDAVLYDLRMRYRRGLQAPRSEWSSLERIDRPRDVSRHRDVARRADDRVPVRHLHVFRPARPAAAPVDPRRAGGRLRAARGHGARPARPGAALRRAARGRRPLHAPARRSPARPRRDPALQHAPGRRRFPCYGDPETMAEVRRVFAYAFEPRQPGGGVPQLELIPVTGPFTVGGTVVTPGAGHARQLPIHGYRVGAFAYLTDCSAIPDESWPLLDGVRRAGDRRAAPRAAPDALHRGAGARRGGAAAARAGAADAHRARSRPRGDLGRALPRRRRAGI